MTEIIEDKKIYNCLRCRDKNWLIQCKCELCDEIIFLRNPGGRLNKVKYGHQNRGKNHATWNGGVFPDGEGYLLEYAPQHPFKNKTNRVRQHRLIYEHYLYILFDEHIYIPKDIHIDHINGIRDDNRIINLRPISPADHNSHHKKKHKGDTTCSSPECKNPTKTYIRKNGFPLWYGNEKDGYLCNTCHVINYLKNKKN